MKIYRAEAGALADATPHQLPDVKSHQALIRDFVRSIQEDTPVPVPGEQPLIDTQILDATYKSSETGKEVRIDSEGA